MPDNRDETEARGARFDRASYERFALSHYCDRDPAHDAAHIRRIFGRLPSLMEDVHAAVRADRLWFLAALHGLAGRLSNDAVFRREVEAFLADIGWQPGEIDDLIAALVRHTTDPQTVEEQLVHDANAMEVVGAFGIAKTFLKGGFEGQSYEETLAMYRRFLDAVRFFTPAARRTAHERRSYSERFVARFMAEAAIDPHDLQTPPLIGED